MTLTEEEALHVSLLSRPDDAFEYVKALATGRRPAVCQRALDLRSSEVAEWRAISTVYDAMCADAEMAGTGMIDDVALKHVVDGTPGWATAFKTLVQRRDPAYADRSQVESKEHVSIVNYDEAKPDEWEKEAAS